MIIYYGLQLKQGMQSPGSGKMEQKMYTGMFGRRVSTATCLGFVILQFLLYAEAGGELASCPAPQE